MDHSQSFHQYLPEQAEKQKIEMGKNTMSKMMNEHFDSRMISTAERLVEGLTLLNHMNRNRKICRMHK